MNTDPTDGAMKIVRTTSAGGYSPKNHTGTINRRMISRETVGAENVEVLIGTIVKGSGAHPHAHPHIEQLGYMLSGTGISVVNGQPTDATPGRWSLLPRGSFHDFKVTSDEAVRVIVVYVPPYREDPTQVTLEPSLADPAGQLIERLAPEMPQATPGKSSVQPIISREKSSAEKVEISLVTADINNSVTLTGSPGVEQVLFVETGRLEINSAEQSLQADEGDWIFIPDGMTASVTASDPAGGLAHLIRASDRKF
jgi:quercetin dioxygenase-like cupin family protein